MEANLSKSEFLNEDGHSFIHPEIAQDDIDRIKQLHTSLMGELRNLGTYQLRIDQNELTDMIIATDQAFGDLFSKPLEEFNAAARTDEPMPISIEQANWLRAKVGANA